MFTNSFLSDINECLEYPSKCSSIDPNAVCIDTIGSFQCSCRRGFEPYFNNSVSPKVLINCTGKIFCFMFLWLNFLFNVKRCRGKCFFLIIKGGGDGEDETRELQILGRLRQLIRYLTSSSLRSTKRDIVSTPFITDALGPRFTVLNSESP